MKEGEGMASTSSVNSSSGYTNVLRLTGMASGLDTESTIKKLMDAESAPLIKLQQKKQRLAENQELIHRIVEKNVDGILILEPTGKIIMANPAARDLLARSPNQFDGQRFNGPLRPGEILEFKSSGLDNQVVYIEMRTTVLDIQGEASYMAVLRDITERKNLEQSLLLRKEYLEVTLRSIADGVLTTDENGIVTSMNQVAENMTQWNRFKAIGHPLSHILPFKLNTNSLAEIPGPFGNNLTNESDLSINKEKAHLDNNKELVKDLNSNPTAFHGTAIYGTGDNETIIEYSGAPILDDETQALGYVLVIRDITAEKKMTEELIKLQRLQSLGRVTRSLAQEYGEILTFVLGSIAVARQDLPPSSSIHSMLDKAQEGAQRARNLTSQLYTFSKDQDFDTSPENTSILSLLKDVCRESLRNTNITAKWFIFADLPPLEFNREQIYIALWNIFKNAVQAMPDQGTLEIGIQKILLGEKSYLNLNAGEFVKISIKDDGIGMDRQTQQKIFDPFFTTREGSLGMGLSIAFSIFRSHYGTITVDSEPDRGSRFNLFLPVKNPGGQNE